MEYLKPAEQYLSTFELSEGAYDLGEDANKRSIFGIDFTEFEIDLFHEMRRHPVISVELGNGQFELLSKLLQGSKAAKPNSTISIRVGFPDYVNVIQERSAGIKDYRFKPVHAYDYIMFTKLRLKRIEPSLDRGGG